MGSSLKARRDAAASSWCRKPANCRCASYMANARTRWSRGVFGSFIGCSLHEEVRPPSGAASIDGPPARGDAIIERDGSHRAVAGLGRPVLRPWPYRGRTRKRRAGKVGLGRWGSRASEMRQCASPDEGEGRPSFAAHGPTGGTDRVTGAATDPGHNYIIDIIVSQRFSACENRDQHLTLRSVETDLARRASRLRGVPLGTHRERAIAGPATGGVSACGPKTNR